ncbi:hypothetical protein [Roseospira goensis]|uniref:Uncharacterized protein n=1 Tax=Roseospira goensis TaxID=391922 RepID=A0A7W6WK04_9PROT|nr:hypothetical protein [Roseospira goensis]MBB4285630.1 hypothetical protein [Roseospira goensis]
MTCMTSMRSLVSSRPAWHPASGRVRAPAARGRLGRLVLAAGAVVGMALPAAAQSPPDTDAPTACAKPLWPMCASDTLAFDDSLAGQRCAQDLRRYIADAERYRDCLAAQVEAVRTQIEEARTLETCLGQGDGGPCADDVRPDGADGQAGQTGQ